MKKLCFGLLAAGVMSASAAGLGDQVVVVYNKAMPGSRELAEGYAQKRGVPARQVLGFNLTTNEVVSREEYRDELEEPLAKAFEKNRLWTLETQTLPAQGDAKPRKARVVTSSQVRFVALCYGIPLRIASQPVPDTNVQIRAELRKDGAAVDTELALLPVLDQKLPLVGPLRNPLFGSTNAAWMHPTNGVLLVTRLDGPSPEIAGGLVEKAILAETRGLWGRAYFDVRNIADTNYQAGDRWIRNSYEIARRLGFESTLDESPATFREDFPMSHVAFYAGWYDGDVSGPFLRPDLEFMPGAAAYHLHSFSASTLRDPRRAWVGPLLARGATATMGCVDEPYLSGTPEVAIFTARLLFNGFTFAEAAYASQPVLSWQTTFVGDPLYQPTAQSPEQVCQSLQASADPRVEWCFLRLLNLNLANGGPLNAGVAFLESVPIQKSSAILTEKLADLYQAQGKPSSAVHELQRALQLNPSRAQRVRIQLQLAERLAALGREAEALDQYATLVQSEPELPGRAGLYKKMVALSEKLGRTEDLEKYKTALQALEPPPVSAP